MSVNLSELLKKGEVRKTLPDRKQAEECLKMAGRDIGIAESLLDINFDGSFAFSYNSMLNSARALMFSDGYATIGEKSHKAAVDYADVKIGAKYVDIVKKFDDMRRKRHKVIYEKVGVISEFEAKYAIKTAKEFLEKIREKIGN